MSPTDEITLNQVSVLISVRCCAFRFVPKNAGEVIFTEGEIGDTFFIVIRGDCDPPSLTRWPCASIHQCPIVRAGVCTVTAKSPESKDVFLGEITVNEVCK